MEKDRIKEMKTLIETLNRYRDEYYNNSNSLVSDQEYDELFDKLTELERETGIYMSNSPTQSVGFEVKSELNKIIHSHSMLSLDKTKSADDLRKFGSLGNSLLSLKMDGLTILLTYDKGELVQAETRGNGEEGEDVTHNAKVFENIPLHIDYTGHLEIEGEAIITYEDFEKINSKLPEDDKYKNPRNLVSGSVRQLDSKIAAQRHIKFIVWKVPTKIGDTSDNNSFLYRLNFVKDLGFDIVPLFTYVDSSSDKENLEKMIEALKKHASNKGYPIDGLVMTYNDIAYGESLGRTERFPRHSVAYKFYDDEYETTLRDIQWGMGKTGSLCPVAVFDPVEIDGSTVEKASVHNLSMIKNLKLGIGDKITVYKANAIIPQIADNLTRSGIVEIPEVCPICGGKTKVVKENDTEVLMCTNDNCQGKLLGRLSHFVSKNAINIDGMSEATLRFMVDELNVKSFKDLYRVPFMEEIYEEWIKAPGFGKRSVDKLRDAIEKSRNTTLDRFLYAQSIPLIGRTASKDISKFCKGNIDTFCDMMVSGAAEELLSIDGFGELTYQSLMEWYENHWIEFLSLKEEFNFMGVEINQNNNESDNGKGADLQGKSFCITGKLECYSNRDVLVSVIEKHGGRYVTGVTSKTDYLINNDVTSTTGKNKKAKDLNIPIISEKELMKMMGVL